MVLEAWNAQEPFERAERHTAHFAEALPVLKKTDHMLRFRTRKPELLDERRRRLQRRFMHKNRHCKVRRRPTADHTEGLLEVRILLHLRRDFGAKP